MNICSYQPTKYLDDKGYNERFKLLFKNVCYLLGTVQTTFDSTADFSVNADPNTVGTTFSPNTPQDTTVIYVSTIDGSLWTWNGSAYVTYTPPVGSANIYNTNGTLLSNRTVFLNGKTLKFVNEAGDSGDFNVLIESFEGVQLSAIGGSTLQGGHLILKDSLGTSGTTLRTLASSSRGVNLPDANGTIVLSVNGQTANSTGAVSLNTTTRVTSQFDKTSDTTLANITGLTATVVDGETYMFEAVLYTTSDSSSGVKFAISGTSTATAIVYSGTTVGNGTAYNQATALDTVVGNQTTITAGTTIINGTITVNTGGTLTVQFAQNVSGGVASSVLVGSTFVVTKIA